MHELSLCEAIAGLVKTHAGDRHVDVVRVRIGALRQVVPESLSFCWTLVRDSENMADAELELECVTVGNGLEVRDPSDLRGERFVGD